METRSIKATFEVDIKPTLSKEPNPIAIQYAFDKWHTWAELLEKKPNGRYEVPIDNHSGAYVITTWESTEVPIDYLYIGKGKSLSNRLRNFIRGKGSDSHTAIPRVLNTVLKRKDITSLESLSDDERKVLKQIKVSWSLCNKHLALLEYLLHLQHMPKCPDLDLFPETEQEEQ